MIKPTEQIHYLKLEREPFRIIAEKLKAWEESYPWRKRKGNGKDKNQKRVWCYRNCILDETTEDILTYKLFWAPRIEDEK